MENNNQEIKEKVATFRRRFGEGCTLRPVPRSLSSSCGTAAYFYRDDWEDHLDENVEGVWERNGEEWRKLYGEE